MKSRRFGVREYHHPDVLDALFEQERESHLLLLIDKEIFGGGRTAPWTGDMQDLKDLLLAENSGVAGSAKRLAGDLGTLGLIMKNLSEQLPDRIQKLPRKADKRLWLITPPLSV